MTVAILLYYSISNTTFRVAERIGRGLQTEGVDVRLHSLRDDPLPYLRRGYLFSPGRPSETDLDEAEEIGLRLTRSSALAAAGGPPAEACASA